MVAEDRGVGVQEEEASTEVAADKARHEASDGDTSLSVAAAVMGAEEKGIVAMEREGLPVTATGEKGTEATEGDVLSAEAVAVTAGKKGLEVIEKVSSKAVTADETRFEETEGGTSSTAMDEKEREKKSSADVSAEDAGLEALEEDTSLAAAEVATAVNEKGLKAMKEGVSASVAADTIGIEMAEGGKVLGGAVAMMAAEKRDATALEAVAKDNTRLEKKTPSAVAVAGEKGVEATEGEQLVVVTADETGVKATEEDTLTVAGAALVAEEDKRIGATVEKVSVAVAADETGLEAEEGVTSLKATVATMAVEETGPDAMEEESSVVMAVDKTGLEATGEDPSPVAMAAATVADENRSEGTDEGASEEVVAVKTGIEGTEGESLAASAAVGGKVLEVRVGEAPTAKAIDKKESEATVGDAQAVAAADEAGLARRGGESLVSMGAEEQALVAMDRHALAATERGRKKRPEVMEDDESEAAEAAFVGVNKTEIERGVLSSTTVSEAERKEVAEVAAAVPATTASPAGAKFHEEAPSLMAKEVEGEASMVEVDGEVATLTPAIGTEAEKDVSTTPAGSTMVLVTREASAASRGAAKAAGHDQEELPAETTEKEENVTMLKEGVLSEGLRVDKRNVMSEYTVAKEAETVDVDASAFTTAVGTAVEILKEGAGDEASQGEAKKTSMEAAKKGTPPSLSMKEGSSPVTAVVEEDSLPSETKSVKDGALNAQTTIMAAETVREAATATEGETYDDVVAVGERDMSAATSPVQDVSEVTSTVVGPKDKATASSRIAQVVSTATGVTPRAEREVSEKTKAVKGGQLSALTVVASGEGDVSATVATAQETFTSKPTVNVATGDEPSSAGVASLSGKKKILGPLVELTKEDNYSRKEETLSPGHSMDAEEVEEAEKAQPLSSRQPIAESHSLHVSSVIGTVTTRTANTSSADVIATKTTEKEEELLNDKEAPGTHGIDRIATNTVSEVDARGVAATVEAPSAPEESDSGSVALAGASSKSDTKKLHASANDIEVEPKIALTSDVCASTATPELGSNKETSSTISSPVHKGEEHQPSTESVADHSSDHMNTKAISILAVDETDEADPVAAGHHSAPSSGATFIGSEAIRNEALADEAKGDGKETDSELTSAKVSLKEAVAENKLVTKLSSNDTAFAAATGYEDSEKSSPALTQHLHVTSAPHRHYARCSEGEESPNKGHTGLRSANARKDIRPDSPSGAGAVKGSGGRSKPKGTKKGGVSVTDADGTVMWEVERVLGRRWNASARKGAGTVEYLTQWRGCPNPEQNTWEPEENFSETSLESFGRVWGGAPVIKDGSEQMLDKDGTFDGVIRSSCAAEVATKKKDVGSSTAETSADVISSPKIPEGGKAHHEKKTNVMKTCPVCGKSMKHYGYLMHVAKCERFKGWKCGECGMMDFRSMSPRLPLPGPGGPHDLCQVCGKRYAAKQKALAEKEEADILETDRQFSLPGHEKSHAPMQEVQAIVQDSALVGGVEHGGIAVDTSRSSQTLESLDGSSLSPRPKRTRRPAKRLEPGKNEPPPYAEWLAARGNKTKDDRALRLALDENSQAAALPMEVTGEREEGSAVKKQSTESFEPVEEKHARTASASFEEDVLAGDGTVWPAYDELLLLQAALSDPEKMICHGPGDWMVENGNEKAIIYHWDEMLRRGLGHGKSVAETIPRNCASQVLSVCIATCSSPGGSSPAAKSVALLAAGWRCIHSEMVATAQRRALSRYGADMLGICRWHHPTEVDSTLLPAMPKKADFTEFVRVGLTLSKAWDAHLIELRSSIEEALIKAEAYQRTKREKLFAGKRDDDLLKDEAENGVPRRPSIKFDDLSTSAKTTLMKRARWVSEGDPRPAFNCAWCGPPQHIEGEMVGRHKEWFEVPGCDACRFLHDRGWRMIHKVTRGREAGGRDRDDFRFLDPNGGQMRGAKLFLTATTKLIASEFFNSEKSKARADSIEQAGEQYEEGMSSDTGEAKVNDPSSTVVPLPTIAQLLNEERGLEGALIADRLGIWNTFYGSDSDIALLVLQSLSTGKLPHLVRLETPFFRSKEELCTLPASTRSGTTPPTRFIGVTRMVERRSSQLHKGKQAFGVEFPIFIVRYDNFGTPETSVSDLGMDPPMPKPATARGKKVLLRADIAREDVAGQLFAFMFRIMYGEKALNDALAKTNETSIFRDTLGAFGVSMITAEEE